MYLRTSFCFSNISSPYVWHRNGFVLKIYVWISIFRRKKTIWKSDIWLLRYKENKAAHFFYTPCSSSKHWINLTLGAPNSGVGDCAFDAIVVQLGFWPKCNLKIIFNTKWSLAPHQIISDTSTTNFSTTSKLCRKFKFGMQALSNPTREIIKKHIQ